MAWFSRNARATVEAAGPNSLRVTDAEGAATLIDLSTLDWIGFLFVGDEFSPVYEGWWLFARASATVAIGTDCPRVDHLLRHEPLVGVADLLDDKVQIDVASRPRELRGASARNGLFHLDDAAAATLRARGVARPVASVRDFPAII